MSRGFRKSSPSRRETYQGKHRFEHWYRDNTVYFITARCRDKYPAFAAEPAKAVFWDRLATYTAEARFTLWLATLMDNHYHLIGYLPRGEALPQMMRKLHGSVAKRVNDLLPVRHVPFWRNGKYHNYFDGCLRDEKQCRLAYQYTRDQAIAAGLVRDWHDYPHTRVWIDLDRGVKRALELNAFMAGVRYPRYEK